MRRHDENLRRFCSPTERILDPARNQSLHREDQTVYSQGLADGVTLLSQELLVQLKPEAVVLEEIKESE